MTGSAMSDTGLTATFSVPVMNSLNDQIHQQLKDKLIVGEFMPGDRLVLRPLATALGTSVVPVRDALQKLASIGALRLGRTFVVPDLTPAELIEIRDIRVSLEGLSAMRAAQACTPEGLAELGEQCEAIATAAHSGDTSAFLRANSSFHLHLARMSGSAILHDMIEGLWLRMGPQVRVAKGKPSQLIEAIEVHRVLLAAIAARDAVQARRAIVADVLGCFGVVSGETAAEEDERETYQHARR